MALFMRAMRRHESVRSVCRSITTAAEPAEPAGPACITFESVSRAELRIQDGIVQTSCIYSPTFSKNTGMNVHLKVDSRQITGSFKERGARNALMQLTDEQRSKGVICASAGNHAMAMAYHGRDLGIQVTCIMPRHAPLTKVNNCRDYEANVILHGEHIGEAFEHAMEIVERDETVYINGYDHPHIIAGAGTMALEILKQLPETDAMVIPIGGGGLIAGMALAAKTLRPSIQIIGAEPKNCASFTAALARGEVCNAEVRPTLADGLAVPQVGSNAFHLAKDLVDQVVCIDEGDIASTVLQLLETEKLVVEGGGAAGLAAVLSRQLPKLAGKNVVVPLCGGNIDMNMLGRVIERGLAADSRLIQFSVLANDRPGGLARITASIGQTGACVKDVHHERAWMDDDVSAAYVVNRFVVETSGKAHSEELRQILLNEGWPLKWNSDQWTHAPEVFGRNIDRMTARGSVR